MERIWLENMHLRISGGKLRLGAPRDFVPEFGYSGGSQPISVSTSELLA